jgi:large subunit ribosomal protein L24e
MVEMRTCSFCGGGVEPGTGKMFVKKDGTLFFFCSTKCQNNYRLGRVPRRVAWTAAGRKALGKE